MTEALSSSTHPHPLPAPPVSDTRLRGGWLWAARGLALGLALLTAWLFFASIPANYSFLRVVCDSAACRGVHLSSNDARALQGLGLSPDSYALYFSLVFVVVALTFSGSAAVLVLRRSDDWLVLFVALMLLMFGTFTLTGAARGLALQQAAWRIPTSLMAWFGEVSIMAFFFIFPTGRLVPRWAWVILVLWAAIQGLHDLWPGSPLDIASRNVGLYALLFVGGIVGGLAAQVYRYFRRSGRAQRQQTKWVVLGVTLAVAGFVASNTVAFFVPPAQQNLLLGALIFTCQIAFVLLLPLSIVVAVLRYRLWDVDPIINRVLVYGALTAIVVALYAGIVGGLGALFQARGNLAMSVLATGVAAVLFEPLRGRLQSGVNRLMYGERDDPATVLARLGGQLEANLAPDAVLPAVVQTVAHALKLPYAAISLHYAGEERLAAEFGRPAGTLTRLPLRYQGATIGELRLAPRASGEVFSPSDQRLMALLAQETGAAAQSVRLMAELRLANAELQHSRERLVAAREEERRRLRRDLHDGLGPTLASLSQRLDRARLLTAEDPAAAAAMLDGLKDQVRSAVADIRHLVYALRPPVLDELGLVTALREHVAQTAGAAGLQVTLEAPEPLPPLPAAVEVAAYRIVLEAFTNVIRHA